MIQFNKVIDLNEFNLLSKKLFKETYKDILSSDQIKYMNEMFFSIDEIITNIKDNYIYEYIIKDNLIAGFIVYKKHTDHIYLSKLYLKNEFKGKNIAIEVFKYLSLNNLDITLNVNKYNKHAIHVYLKNGFIIDYEYNTDIGNNYLMEDYIMKKIV